MTYCVLYLFFRSGQNDGCRDLSIDIRPSLGILLKSSIIRVGQDLDVRAKVALKLAEKMRVELWRHSGPRQPCKRAQCCSGVFQQAHSETLTRSKSEHDVYIHSVVEVES